MTDAEFRNKVTLLNGKWDSRIRMLKQQMAMCEQKLAAVGTPAPGRLPPVAGPAQSAELRSLELQITMLVQQYNQASRGWLEELLRVPRPAPAAGLKQKIPWPNWVGNKGQDFIMRAIDQGGVPVTDSITVKKAPGTWTGIMVEYNW